MHLSSSSLIQSLMFSFKMIKSWSVFTRCRFQEVKGIFLPWMSKCLFISSTVLLYALQCEFDLNLISVTWRTCYVHTLLLLFERWTFDISPSIETMHDELIVLRSRFPSVGTDDGKVVPIRKLMTWVAILYWVKNVKLFGEERLWRWK